MENYTIFEIGRGLFSPYMNTKEFSIIIFLFIFGVIVVFSIFEMINSFKDNNEETNK